MYKKRIKKIKRDKNRFFPCLAFAPFDLCTNLVVKYDTYCYQKLQSFWTTQHSAEEVSGTANICQSIIKQADTL